MKDFLVKNKEKAWMKVLEAALLFLIIETGLALVLNRGTSQKVIQGIMLVMIFLGLCVYAYLKSRTDNRLKIDFISLILFLGFVMRIGYCLYNNFYARNHDMGLLENIDEGSKTSYLVWLISNHSLPDTYFNQLYHPPFSYLASALSVAIGYPLLEWKGDLFCLASLGKASNCLATCISLYLVPKLCDETGIGKRAKEIATILVAFCPVFYFHSGTIIEDAFTCTFVLGEVLYTLRWEKNPTWKNTVVLAVLFGLGLMNSLICVLPAVYTAYIFIRRLVREKHRRDFWVKDIVFVLISFPIGLWSYVRNYIEFGIPFTYILEQTPGNWLDRSNYSVTDRFLKFDFQELLQSPYTDPATSYNLPLTTFKTELFDEFSFEVNSVFPYIMLIIDMILTALVLIAGIVGTRKLIKEKKCAPVMLMGVIFGAFTVYSYATQPFACTMVARYYIALFVFKAIMIGAVSDSQLFGKRFSAVVRGAVLGLSMVFAGVSVSIFCLM